MLIAAPSHAVVAQAAPLAPDTAIAKPLVRMRLSGPRFGFTTFTGKVADLRDKAGLEPIMTQFGWQWETQIHSGTGGNQVLMEWVLLAGGVEQDEFNTSLGWLTGYRLPTGLELGFGPNFSVTKKFDHVTSSMVVAGGSTMPFGDIRVPINVAVAMAKGGPRITALTGWIIE